MAKETEESTIITPIRGIESLTIFGIGALALTTLAVLCWFGVESDRAPFVASEDYVFTQINLPLRLGCIGYHIPTYNIKLGHDESEGFFFESGEVLSTCPFVPQLVHVDPLQELDPGVIGFRLAVSTGKCDAPNGWLPIKYIGIVGDFYPSTDGDRSDIVWEDGVWPCVSFEPYDLDGGDVIITTPESPTPVPTISPFPQA